MAKKLHYVKGGRFHRGPDGKVRPCTASKRSCPYLEVDHFDTVEEAYSDRQRVSTRILPTQIVYFNVNVKSNGEEGDLRRAANQARDNFISTGKRTSSPLGEIDVELPGDQKITLRRETFDRPGRGRKLGTRYYMRYFSSPGLYEQSLVELDTKLDYEILVKKLDDYYTEAADNAARYNIPPKEFMESYKKTLQTINEIEVMGMGVENSIKHFGIDVFSKGEVDSLRLETNYGNSTLTHFDVMESLKMHSSMDNEIKSISILVSDEIPNTHGDKWQIERLAEGGWYLGADSAKGVVAENIPNADVAVDKLNRILGGHKVPEADRKPILDYVYGMINEVEPAIKNYEVTVRNRVEEEYNKHAFKEAIREENGGHLPPQYAEGYRPSPQSSKSTFGEKIGKLFS